MKEERPEKYTVEDRIVRLKLVDGTMINGQVNIARGHGYERLSELLGDGEDPFLILFHVTLYDKNADNAQKFKTLFVNKTQILWAEPDEDQK